MMKGCRLNCYEMSGIKGRVRVARKCWPSHVNALKNLQDEILEIKLIKEALDKESVRNLRWPYNINPNCVFVRN